MLGKKQKKKKKKEDKKIVGADYRMSFFAITTTFIHLIIYTLTFVILQINRC